MINIDKFLVKEGETFFVNLKEWKPEDGMSLEDGDTIKFNYDGKRYIGTLFDIKKGKDFFEFVNVKELSK
jgi:FKBP-type peptidyl-prolyl cis-trans isomerase